MSRSEIRKRRREYTAQFFKGNKTAFSIALIQTVIMVFGNLIISWLLQVLIDVTTGAENRFTLPQIAVLCLIGLGVLILASWLGYLSTPRFIAKAIGQYKEYVFDKISKKGISAFTGENSSFYISALSNDANTIETDYLADIIQLIDEILLFLGALALMFWYSPLLTGIAIALSLLPVAASVLVGNRMAEVEKALSQKNQTYMSTLTDCLAGFSVVKSFKAEAAMCRLFAQRIKEVTEAKTLRRKTMIVVQSMGLVAGVIAQFGVFLAGAALAMKGYGISAGMLIAFVNLMNFVVSPIRTVPQYFAECKASCALIDKLAAALEQNVREDGLEDKTKLEKCITLENLSFGYGAEKTILQNIDFSFEAGKSYAIVGASGSGKSTLLNLLMASHPDYTGDIRYDDTELRRISSESLYEMVSIVQQNVFIFNATIRENITMFTDFPKEEVDRAIEMSGLSELIAERGEDYLCGENGSGLSGGERQRISIARSLLKKSQILLVDEATAALDIRTAYQVSNAILNLHELTRIVVTHSLEENLLKRYDCVLTLKNGRVAEYGSFDELMAKKEYFYSLFNVSQG